jgi:enoyl-CoA hydratase/carnithine racemase
VKKGAASISDRINGGVAVLEFDSAHAINPFSQIRMRELASLVTHYDGNDEARVIVLYGGDGRSFAVGGDFHETSEFRDDAAVDSWIDDIADLYTALAGGRKPLVAAIDGYCIGLGLQIALCCDYRLGSSRSTLLMPELKLGIACTFGAYMLEALVGRAVMQAMVFSGDPWTADRARSDGLLHEVVESEDLLFRGLKRATAIAEWTTAAVCTTRPQANSEFVAGLERCREAGKMAHRAAFGTGEAQKRMRDILERGEQHRG